MAKRTKICFIARSFSCPAKFACRKEGLLEPYELLHLG
jgi:hypothetical protein